MPDCIDLTITIVSWNTCELLRGCLRSIAESGTTCHLQIHVVDNASQDHSVAMVRSEFPDVKVIANQQNLGFAAANNQSWQQAHGRYWMLLNSDAEVKPGALDALVKFMDAHPHAGLATARLVNPDGTPQHCAQPAPSILRTLLEVSRLHKLLPASWRGRLFLGPYWHYQEALQLGWTWGTALIARRCAVEEAGPLCEDFFMYGEDLEWCLRMQKRGWKVWYCHAANVLHYGGQSSVLRWEGEQKQKIILDNCYRAIAKHRSVYFVRALQGTTWATLKLEQVIQRWSGRQIPETQFLIDYHKNSLKRQLA